MDTYSQQELATRYGMTTQIIRKWQRRVQNQVHSHRPHNLQTTLSPDREAMVVELLKDLQSSHSAESPWAYQTGESAKKLG